MKAAEIIFVSNSKQIFALSILQKNSRQYNIPCLTAFTFKHEHIELCWPAIKSTCYFLWFCHLIFKHFGLLCCSEKPAERGGTDRLTVQRKHWTLKSVDVHATREVHNSKRVQTTTISIWTFKLDTDPVIIHYFGKKKENQLYYSNSKIISLNHFHHRNRDLTTDPSGSRTQQATSSATKCRISLIWRWPR